MPFWLYATGMFTLGPAALVLFVLACTASTRAAREHWFTLFFLTGTLLSVFMFVHLLIVAYTY